ncbi:MAG: toast rack family protein, partial [Anaerolineales bacterium]
MKRLFAMVVVLALATLACGPNFDVRLPTLKTGPDETVNIDEAAPDAEVAKVNLEMGAGNLVLAGGSDSLVSGAVTTNVAEWKPTVARDGETVTIQQGDTNDNNFGIPDNDVKNAWDLKLGSMPLELEINAGAYDGKIELGGLHLQRININDGAATSKVNFEEPNLGEMKLLRYSTGASTVTLTNLANANFDELVFDGGAGTYTLDFGGTLARDGTVNIEVGVCTLTLIIPSDTPAKVNVTGGLNTINT